MHVCVRTCVCERKKGKMPELVCDSSCVQYSNDVGGT